jgi:hypothetical protein
MNPKTNKIIASLLLLAIFLTSYSPLLATQASAQWAVWDVGNAPLHAISASTDVMSTSKEYGLDALAWVIVNLIISRMSAETVRWINGGFQGQPAYITNPGAYFGDISDKIAGQFIFTNPNLNFLCGPMQNRIKIALSRTYNRQNIQWRCTLSDAIGNMEDFLNDFERGGWDKFWRISMETGNNPLGAYIQAESDLYEVITGKQGEKSKEIDLGRGFLTQKQCKVWGAPFTRYEYDLDGTAWEVQEPGPCLKEETVTPGSVIETKLNEVLNIGNDKLAVADEINELVSALLNQLITKIVGGGGSLRSLSSPDPSNNYKIFTNLLASSTASTIEDYFGNKQNTEILDEESPNLEYKPPNLVMPASSTPPEPPFQPQP